MDVLVVDDEKTVRQSTQALIDSEGHYAETADGAQVAMLKLKEDQYDLVLLDLKLGEDDGLEVLRQIKKIYPRLPVVIFTAHAGLRTAVKATQAGAMDYIEKPFTADRLRQVLALAQKTRRMETRIGELEEEVQRQSPEPEFESTDHLMREAYDIMFRAADTPATIVILGESGTGKSVAARAVHTQSSYASKPFVTVSCPSLSKELLESELFGHLKGSFTGAVKDTWGKVKAAEGGTLFLDEIGELPLEIQPKLLRLLQEREYERLGESKPRQANVRIIAATNRDLKQSVEAGEFREDLYFRLNVITVEMPPLRARPEDLAHFATKYLTFFATQFGRPVREFSPEAFDCLRAYEWPGNLRELRNAIERAVILARGEQITPADLGTGPSGATAVDHDLRIGASIPLETVEAAHIRQILAQADSMQEAADILGIDQTTLYRKRKKLSLD
ncbi:MAG: NtrC-family two-component system response regulator AlgB [Verrucomicrobiales bacterium]|jgi:NtrC-family two-component system response regulator AlgB